jgi:hypothetical protein
MLKAVGATLYGPQYQSELARQLSVHLRTFTRWQRGERTIPDDLDDQLIDLLLERQRLIHRLLYALKGE